MGGLQNGATVGAFLPACSYLISMFSCKSLFKIFILDPGFTQHSQNLKKILIWGLRGIKFQKFGIFDIFSDTVHWNFLIFSMMVKGSRAHDLSMVAYSGKFIIYD